MWHKKDGKNDAYDIIGNSSWEKYSSSYTSATSDNGFTVVASNSTESLVGLHASIKNKPNKINSTDGKKRLR